MKTLNVLLYFLVNCALHFEILCYENESNSYLPFFLFGQKKLLYAKDNKIENLINFWSYTDIEITSFDYYVDGPGSLFFWTSPPRRFWVNQPERTCKRKYQLYLSGRNYLYTCDEQKIDSLLFGHEHCTTNSSGSYEYLPFTVPLRPIDTWKPRSVAIDYIGKRMYIVDTDHRSVNVMDMNSHEKATVFELEPLIPFKVVLDPPQGVMFVLAVNAKLKVSQIYRMNMDGTESLLISDNVYQQVDVNHIFSTSEMTAFTLDTTKKRVYFGNYKDKIVESVDYNGNGRQIVTQVKYPYSIAIYNNTLYWSDPQLSITSSSSDGNEKCNFQTCALTETGICQNETIKEFLSINGACSIQFFYPNRRLQNLTNPCETNNGGCQHQCLLKPSKTENHSLELSCICNNGYQLAENLKNCTRKKVTHVYDQVLVPYNLGFNALSEPATSQQIYPISRNLLIRLSYSKPDTIFHAAPFHFIQVDKNSRKISDRDLTSVDLLVRSINETTEKNIKVEVLRSYNNAGIAKAITYDWITETLYFVKMPNGEEFGELTAASIADRHTFYMDVRLATIYQPISLTVHPYRGYIFAALHNGSTIRLNTDGTDEILFPALHVIATAIDFNEDKLYWLSKNKENNVTTISYGDLDGSSFRLLIASYSKDCKEIFTYVYGDHLYIKCEGENELFIEDDKFYKNKRIYRYNKLTGVELGSLEISPHNFLHDNVGMKVLAKDAQFVNEDEHPCVVKYGGCDNYCFGKFDERVKKLVKVCACDKGGKYTENKMKCNIYEDMTKESEDYDKNDVP